MKRFFERIKGRNKTLQTLQKDSGVTIVFALVMFLIASIVSITIVNIALSNTGSLAERKTNEQKRLAVMSAARYLESNRIDINGALAALGAPGDTWKINVSDSDADKALSATVTWTDVNPGTSLTARITAGDYSAEVRLVYDAADENWSISRLKKI